MDKAQFYQKTKGWGIFVVLGICVLAVFGLSGQQKAKAYNPSVRTESIKILPGGMNGDSDGWENGVALFSQDLGATAATGEFDRSNSAFFIDPQAETAATDPEADISDKNIQSDNTPEKRADSKNESEPAASETKTGPTTEENVSEPVPAEDTAPKNESVPGGEPETQVLYTIIGQESPEWIAANDAPGSATDAITDINASTTPAVEQAAGGEVEGIPAVTNAVGGDGASTGTEQAPVDATGDAASKPKKITITKPAFEKSFQLSRFDTDGTMDGTAIKNIQLRFSMAATKPAREADEANLLTVSYSSAGAEWQTLEQIDLNTERSNALNNGYFLAALPNVDTFSDLKDLEVRFTYNASSPGSGQTVYIEAVWLEASYAAPLTSDELADQMRQQVIEKYYRSDQNPTFVFTNLEDKKNFFQKIFAWFSGEKREVSAKITNPRGEESNEGVVIDGENVKIGNIDNWKFRPGRYKVEITVKDGNKENVEIQEFEWGVLTVNSDKSLYKTGDTANINLGVLNEYGHTVCDADVILSVTDPDGDKSYPEVLPSDDCGLDNITETPDYSASYEVAKQGTYKIEVIASTETGTLEITDAFDGMDSVDFGVQRIGPTRINPAAIYTMRFKVTAGKDFSGKMTEFIPADFDIYEVSGSDGATTTAEIADSPVAADTFDGGATTTDEISDSSGAVVQTADNDPATIEVTDAVKMISWNVEMKTGQTYDFSYTFKAPALSPYIFLMGPLQIGDFTESRQWQIASDGTCNSSKTGYWDDTTVWSCGARPGSGDDVTVTAGYTVTIRQTEYASTLSVTESGSGTSILAIGAYSLTVGTTVGITRGSSSGYNAKITIGGGTLTVGTNLTLTSASSGGATLDISGGASTVYVGGNFTVSNTTAGYCTFTPGTSSTVNYNGAGAQGMLGTTYYNLTHSAAGTGTISAATVVNGNFNVSAGTVAFTTRALTLNGNFTNSATVTATSSALTIGGSSSSPSIAGYTTTGGCTFSRTANTATLTGNLTCGSLTMNGTNGTLDLGAGLTHTINGNITLTAGTLLGNSSNLSLIGTWSGAATFTEQNSTVTFASTDSQTVPARSYYSLVSTSTGARTLSNSATTYIAGDFSPGSNTWTTTGTTMTFNGSVSWPYRKQVTITGQSGAGTDYQILLNVGESSGATGEDFDLANHATNFPNDIMFTASDGQTILPYFTESTTGTTPNRLAKIWVKVSANLNTNQNIYVYYGKTGAPSQSSGDKTFRFFDDFNDGTIDANKWTTGNIATYCSNTEASGYLRQSCTTYNAKLYVFAISKSTLTYPMTVEWSGEVGASDIHDSIATGPSGTTCTYDTCSTDTTTSMRSDATFAVATFAQGSTTVNTQRINAGTWVRHVEKLASGAGNINVGGTDYANTGSISQSDDYLILNIRKWDSTRDCISDYDWIFVRKYSATEPAYNTSGSEESVSGLTQLIPAFTYNNLNIYPAVNNATAILGSGTITVNGALNVGNGTNTGVVVTAAATDPNITVVGAFTVNTNTTFTSTDDASKTLNIDGALTITGTFTAPAGTSSTSFTLGGNFVNNGVFNNNSGRITLDGNGTATNQTLSGSTTPTTFYQFYITAGGTRTVYFTDNNHYGIAANGTFSLTGTTSYALTVTRAASTAAWYLDVSSTNTTVSVLYTTAAWSNASGGKEINATGGTNTNGNNNTNWVFVITNYPPTWSTNPHENPTSDNSTPTGVGTNLVINAIAADTESNQYYLAVCKTNAIVANSNSAPTCTGGAWAISAATNAGSEATASYTVLASDTAESYDWYAFACDITVSQYGCTAMSNSGTSGNNGTPFAVDHRPTFTSVANDGAKNPGDTQTITAGSWADSDTAGGQDLGSMYVCKSNDFTGTACGTGGTWCSVTNVAPPANAWLSDYAYRVKIPANATTAGVQTDYTLSLNIVKGTGTNTAGTIYLNSHALNWPYDVRFTAADGSTEISSYRKEYDTTHGTWEIKLNYIGAAGTSDFYIYYGKSAATDSSTIYYANIWGDSFFSWYFTDSK